MSSPLYFRENIVVLDTTVSNGVVGSLLLYGGLTISNTSDVSGLSSGGAFTTLGGMSVSKTLSVDGVGKFNNDLQSDNDSTGSVVILGGVGIGKKVHVKESVHIKENLSVTGASVLAQGLTTGSLNVTGGSVFANVSTIDTSGNLGLGTTSPSFRLDMNGQLRVNAFSAGNALVVKDYGYVGINKENPMWNLNVVGTAGVEGSLTLQQDARGNNKQFYITDTNNQMASLSIGFFATENIGVIETSNYFGGTPDIILNRYGGDVGIGTTSPVATLDVNGTLYVAQSATTGALSISSTEDALSHTAGAAVVVEGGVNVKKNLFVGGPGLKIPSGDTASRPDNPVQGYVRYNTEYSQFEGFGAGSAWGSLGGVADIAQTTKILASETPGVTDGNLYFFNVGGETMRLNSAGNVGIGTTAPTAKLEVIGTLKVAESLAADSLTIASTEDALSHTGSAALVVEGGVNVKKNLFVAGPGLKIPSGDTASRPENPVQGYVRYNTEYSQFEGFGAGSAWGSLGGVADIAQTTKILASETPGVTDGNLYFFNVGGETMRLNSAGNVGIGTTAPAGQLHIKGDDEDLIVLESSDFNSSSIRFNTTGQDWRLGARNQYNIPDNSFYISNVETGQYAMVISSSGNIGLGDETPLEKLSIRNGNLSFDVTGYIGVRGYGNNNQLEMLIFKGQDVNNSNDPERLRLMAPEVRFDTYDTSIFTISDVGTAGSTRMIIASTGNIGIGTNTPNVKLDVIGSFKVAEDSDSGAPGQITITGASDTSRQLLIGYNTFNNYGTIQPINQGYGFTNLVLMPGGGNVGVGTASPASKLDVNGDITSLGVTTGTAMISNGTVSSLYSDLAVIVNATLGNLTLETAVINNGTVASLYSDVSVLVDATVGNLNVNSESVATAVITAGTVASLYSDLSVMVDATLGNAHINSESVATAVITAGTVASLYSDLSVMVDATLGNAHINSESVATAVITAGTVASLYSDLSLMVDATVGNLHVNSESVATAVITAGTVASLFSSLSVLSDATVGNAHINSESVATAVITAGTVASLYSDLSVMVDATLGNAHINSESVATAVITAGTVASLYSDLSVMVDATLGNAHINSESVATAVITAGTVASLYSDLSVIMDVTVGNAHINSESVATAVITAGTVASLYSDLSVMVDATLGNAHINSESVATAVITNGTVATLHSDLATVVNNTIGELTVTGNTVLKGDLTVLGTQTQVNLESTTLNIGDNLILLNAGPLGMADAGILIARGTVGEYATTFYNTPENEFVFGYTSSDATGGNITLNADTLEGQQYADVRLFTLYAEGNIEMLNGQATLASAYIDNGTVSNLYVNNMNLSNATIASLFSNLSVLSDATVGNAHINSESVATAVITAGTVASLYSDLSVMVDATVGNAHINSESVATAVITAGTVASLYSDLSVLSDATLGNAHINSESVATAVITDGTVGSLFSSLSVLSDATVGNAHINSESVATAVITDGTVASLFSSLSVLSDATVGNVHINSESVATAVITAGTVASLYSDLSVMVDATLGNAHINSESVATAVITAGTVASLYSDLSVMVDATLGNAHINSESVATAVITDGTVGSLFSSLSVLSDATVGNAHINSESVATAVITDGTVGSLFSSLSVLSDATVGNAYINSESVATAVITDGTVGSLFSSLSVLSDATVGNAHINSESVATAVITDGTVGSLFSSLSVLSDATVGNAHINSESVATAVITDGTVGSLFSSLSVLSDTTVGNAHINSESVATAVITDGTVGSLFSSLSVLSDATVGNLTVTAGLVNNSTIVSSASSVGSLVLFGGLGINNTSDAVSGTEGGALTIAGGVSISKKVFISSVEVTPSLGDIVAERAFSTSATSGSVSGLSFDNSLVRSFNVHLSVFGELNSVAKYANYEIKGIQKGAGNWQINTQYIGDSLHLQFSISTTGSLSYNYLGEDALTQNLKFQFTASTTSIEQ